MRALILANGELYKSDILRRRISDDVFDLVLGADGGARYADALDVIVDAIIGDSDSLSGLEQHRIGNVKLVSYPVEKDETDLELAILYAEEQGADQIVIVGALGGRMDMTIANMLLMTKSSFSSFRIEVWHGEQTGWVINPPGGDITGQPGDIISLIPVGGNAKGITTVGLKYSLIDEELSMVTARGISNLMESPFTHVSLSDGLLLVVHTPGGNKKGWIIL